MEVGREIRRLREARSWSQAKLAGETGMGVSGISQIETGSRNPSALTLSKIAGAFGVEVGDLFPKAESPLYLEEAARPPEERMRATVSLAAAVESLSRTYRQAFEHLAGAPAYDIGGLYLQASLIHIGAEHLAEDAGYSISLESDSLAEREAKRRLCAALEAMEKVADDLQQVMREAEAEEELPEGVASLARYQRRGAG